MLFERAPEPGTLVQHFKDDAAALNNQKRGTITGKGGVLNNRICEFLMLKLAEIGIPHAFRAPGSTCAEQLVREVEIIPLRATVRNVAAGRWLSGSASPRGTQLPRSIIEYHHKKAELGDPLVSEGAHHRLCLGEHPGPRRNHADFIAGQRFPDRGFSSGSASGSSISGSSSAGSTATMICASSSPTRSAPDNMRPVGHPHPARSSTRTAFAKTSNRSPRAIRRSPPAGILPEGSLADCWIKAPRAMQ